MKNRYLAMLLLALPFIVAMVPAVAGSDRTIDIAMSPSGIVPDRIEMRIGEHVRLRITSTEGAQLFQANAFGLRVRIPASPEAVTIDLVPSQIGIFQTAPKGHFVVTP